MDTFLVNTQREMTEIKLGARKSLGFPVGTVVKNLPAIAGDARDTCLIPGSGRSPGGGHGNHSSILVWRTSWTQDPGGLQSMGLHGLGQD